MTRILREKTVKLDNGKCKVTLMNDNGDFIVKADKEVVYKSANEVFAVQKFNEI